LESKEATTRGRPEKGNPQIREPAAESQPEKGFRRLIAWQKGHQLALAVYEATKGFPSDERFGLVSQVRRAAVSVPANIAEGYTRRHTAEFRQALNVAKGSLAELEYYVELSRDLGYVGEASYASLYARLDEQGGS